MGICFSNDLWERCYFSCEDIDVEVKIFEEYISSRPPTAELYVVGSYEVNWFLVNSNWQYPLQFAPCNFLCRCFCFVISIFKYVLYGRLSTTSM